MYVCIYVLDNYMHVNVRKDGSDGPVVEHLPHNW